MTWLETELVRANPISRTVSRAIPEREGTLCAVDLANAIDGRIDCLFAGSGRSRELVGPSLAAVVQAQKLYSFASCICCTTTTTTTSKHNNTFDGCDGSLGAASWRWNRVHLVDFFTKK